jgi:hypothetical protein
MKGDYNNNPAGGDEENKPKQSQFHTPALAEGVGTREKSVTAATG